MREILFRGKRVDNGEWIEGFFFQIWERTYILWGTTNGAPNMIEVDPLTVGQYTGLTEKNGKKVFEGDIVRHGYTCTYSDGKTADFYSNMPVSFSNHYGGCLYIEDFLESEKLRAQRAENKKREEELKLLAELKKKYEVG